MTVWPRRRTSRSAAAAAIAVIVGLLATGCTTAGADTTGSRGYVTGDGSVTLIAPEDRKQAPTLKGDVLGGGTLDTADFAGQVIVLNVWGSWCAECRGEAPDLAEAARSLPDVQFVGLDTRDPETSAAEAFVRTFDIPYPSLIDQDSRLLLPFYHIINPNSIPSTIIVDSHGRVAAVVTGATIKSTIVGLVQDVEKAS
ncbi:MAG: TlpA disulfide reductase family protein [Nocardioidaceae bacterium]